MGRLGLFGRLSAIVFLSFMALLAVIAGINYAQRDVEAPRAGELAVQVAGIVRLLERPAEDREAVLQAVNGNALTVTIAAERPVRAMDERQLRGAEQALAIYLDRLPGREVVILALPDEDGRLSRWAIWRSAEQRIRLAVKLADGDWAVIETGGDLGRRLFGLAPGFWLAAAGFLVGAVALITLSREARPLRALAASVQAFQATAEPRRVAPAGAPEIRSLIEAVNRMQERIAALLRGRVTLLAGISHDVKTYVTRLRLRAEAIEDDGLRTKIVGDLEEMTALIDDALSVARGAAAPERREPVDLAALAASIALETPGASARANGAVRTMGDPLALKRALANVVANAVRYGERARIAVAQSGDRAVVTVEDDGPGIPAAERLAVFEPFHRLEGSRSRSTGGSGLGLAIVQQIVEAHGGSVTIGDAPSGGAQVVLTFTAIV